MSQRIFPFILLFFSNSLSAAENFEYFPGAVYDPSIPTVEQVLGYSFGDQISLHRDVEQYMKVLAEASPCVALVKFGESWEGRPLYYLIVSAKGNLARIDAVKAGMQRLSDPRQIDPDEADQLMSILPAVTWLSYGIHGNETSSTEAALLTAYHLSAVLDDPLAEHILQNTIVIIDPVQNPDGRDRFVNYFRQARGPRPNPNQEAAEHHEPWPSGRVNHYLFDMNRDWFAMTQIESRARVKAYMDWFPVVFADLHEMGSDSTYYFPPAAPPVNPHVTSEQVDWITAYGKNNARWFDQFGFDYFTREVFDAFFPGYGTSWPMMHGSIGMTYEQASVRGLVVRRSDETLLFFRDAIRHHFITSLSTAEITARNRIDLLKYFYDFRVSAIEEGREEELKEYIIPPGRDANRVAKLAALLLSQGVELRVSEEGFKNAKVSAASGGEVESREFPPGSFVISLSQPAKRLLRTLMDQRVPMEKQFVEEQIRLIRKRQPDQIYDVTSWSLPLLYGIKVYEARTTSEGHFRLLPQAFQHEGELVGSKAGVAYLIPWGRNSSALVLSELLAREIRVFFAGKSLTMNGVQFPAGSLVVKVKDNPSNLHAIMGEISADLGVKIYATDTGWVDDGINLGSGHIHYLKPPRIALAWSEPTHPYSAGWTRYLLEQMYRLPVTAIHTERLRQIDLGKYNVLILPDCRGRGYSGVLGAEGAEKLKEWTAQGGTLVTLASATLWLTNDEVGLLPTRREFRGGRLEGAASDSKREEKPDSLSTEPDQELPPPTSGAILQVDLDEDHWLSSGYLGPVEAIFEGRNIFSPLKLDEGRNVGVFASESKLVSSGFVLDEVRQQLPGKAYLMYRAHGRGHVVAFAQDPNYRAYFDGLNLLFLNPVFFGPGL